MCLGLLSKFQSTEINYAEKKKKIEICDKDEKNNVFLLWPVYTQKLKLQTETRRKCVKKKKKKASEALTSSKLDIKSAQISVAV